MKVRRDAGPAHAATFAVVVLAALALRLVLAPLTAGWDFQSFERLARLTLHGHDVYAMSRRQTHAAAWTYLPPCLYMYSLLESLSTHLGWSFRLLGKLPTIIADLGVGVLVYRALRAHRHSFGLALLGMTAYLFNPLVLLNGAVLGRFDALALAFLMLAIVAYYTPSFAPAYALSIAIKTFPAFLLPLFALGRERQPVRRLVLASIIVALFTLPISITDPKGLIYQLTYHTRGRPGGWMSWYLIVLHYHWLPERLGDRLANDIGLYTYLLTTCVLVRCPLYVKAAFGLALFAVFSPTVYEQYLAWPLPFLVIVGLHYRGLGASALVVLYTVAGLVENELTWLRGPLHYHVLPTPYLPLNAVLVLVTLVIVVSSLFRDWTPRDPGIPGRHAVLAST